MSDMRLAWATPLPVAACAAILLAGAPAGSAATPACHSAVHHGVLPSWARTGFSSPRPRLPHVLGRSGRIAALVFGYPLLSPPAETRANKILWVSRRSVEPLSDLRIRAQRMKGRERVGRPVVRVVRGGPGPSYVNLPVRGCWRLTLRWSGRTDQLDLDYFNRP
jgi:hypothetical protein